MPIERNSHEHIPVKQGIVVSWVAPPDDQCIVPLKTPSVPYSCPIVQATVGTWVPFQPPRSCSCAPSLGVGNKEVQSKQSTNPQGQLQWPFTKSSS